VESGTATRHDIDTAEVEYEAKVKILIELNTTMGVACDDIVTECVLAIPSEDMAKA
jgi:hypothetical protein